MFFDLFNIKPPEWHQAFIDGRRLTSRFPSETNTVLPLTVREVYRKTRRNVDVKSTEGPHKQQDALKLTDQYIGLLIMVFNGVGLMDVCVHDPSIRFRGF